MTILQVITMRPSPIRWGFFNAQNVDYSHHAL
jgi:hypothetical protein